MEKQIRTPQERHAARLQTKTRRCRLCGGHLRLSGNDGTIVQYRCAKCLHGVIAVEAKTARAMASVPSIGSGEPGAALFDPADFMGVPEQ